MYGSLRIYLFCKKDKKLKKSFDLKRKEGYDF